MSVSVNVKQLVCCFDVCSINSGVLHTCSYSILESADGAIMLFDVTNKQSLVNLVSDEDNSRQIKRSWMKELKFKAKGDKYPVMILG